MSSTPTVKADGTVLTGVSETALMILHVRANEARRPDSIIDDPMAIQLADSIDFDFDFAKFGFSRRQDMAVRAVAYDRNTRRYLVDHPRATVVALAEGLQTSSTASSPPASVTNSNGSPSISLPWSTCAANSFRHPSGFGRSHSRPLTSAGWIKSQQSTAC